MGTKNYGLPTNVYGRIQLRYAVLNGFAALDAELKRLDDASAGNADNDVKVADITDATTVGRAVLAAEDAGAARQAIGAGTSDFSGSYKDLSDTPTIPAAPPKGTPQQLEGGTDNTGRLWSAQDLTAEISRRIADAMG